LLAAFAGHGTKEYRPDAGFDRDYETRLHDYYRFPYYWL